VFFKKFYIDIFNYCKNDELNLLIIENPGFLPVARFSQVKIQPESSFSIRYNADFDQHKLI
jgi:hypothetical protein